MSKVDRLTVRVEELERKVLKLDSALRWPTLAWQEGYSSFAKIADQDDLQLLLEHLNLSLTKEKRSIRVKTKQKEISNA